MFGARSQTTPSVFSHVLDDFFHCFSPLPASCWRFSSFSGDLPQALFGFYCCTTSPSFPRPTRICAEFGAGCSFPLIVPKIPEPLFCGLSSARRLLFQPWRELVDSGLFKVITLRAYLVRYPFFSFF